MFALLAWNDVTLALCLFSDTRVRKKEGKELNSYLHMSYALAKTSNFFFCGKEVSTLLYLIAVDP